MRSFSRIRNWIDNRWWELYGKRDLYERFDKVVRSDVLAAAQNFIQIYGTSGAQAAAYEAHTNAKDAGDYPTAGFLHEVQHYLVMTEFNDPATFKIIEPDGKPTSWETMHQFEWMGGGPHGPAAG